MELLVLILVNIATSVVIYFIFAIRFRVAVEKARRAPIMQDLRDNIEAAIEYIGTSIELMDRKSRAFQQAVGQAQRIAERLEASLEAQALLPKPRARRGRKSAPVPDDKSRDSAPSLGTDAPEGAPAEVTSPPMAGVGADAFDRLLARLGEDRFSMSDLNPAPGPGTVGAGAVPRGGDPSADRSASAGAAAWSDDAQTGAEPVQTESATGRGLGLVGSLLGRLFGMKKLPAGSDLLPRPAADSGRPAAARFPDSLREAAELEETHSPREAGGAGKPASAAQSDQRPPFQRGRADSLQISQEAIVAADRQDPMRSSAGPPVLEPSVTSAAEEPPVESTQRAPLSAFAPSETEPGDPERGQDRDPLLEAPPREPIARREYVRNLLGRGFSPDRISRATGISRAEIELTALLPARTGGVRRLRRGGE